MKTVVPTQEYDDYYFKANIVPDVPDSGFELNLGFISNNDTGSFETGIQFRGESGYIFGPENKFFGGYQSGKSFNIDGYMVESGFSYFFDGVLVQNNLQFTGGLNAFEFDKHGNTELDIEFSYTKELIGLQDSSGIFLISSDNLYIVPL
ncbi:hypothetical protein N9955_00820 [bacterium]|nr:hypothetical protein [bacterium]